MDHVFGLAKLLTERRIWVWIHVTYEAKESLEEEEMSWNIH